MYRNWSSQGTSSTLSTCVSSTTTNRHHDIRLSGYRRKDVSEYSDDTCIAYLFSAVAKNSDKDVYVFDEDSEILLSYDYLPDAGVVYLGGTLIYCEGLAKTVAKYIDKTMTLYPMECTEFYVFLK